MAKRIHFEDDIFYLNLLIRTFRDGLELDLDTELFLTKAIDELSFIDDVFERLLDELGANERLIDRVDHLMNLLEAEERFAETVGRVFPVRRPHAQALSPFSERFAELRTKSLRRRSVIEGATAFKSDAADDPYVVSQVELNELLKEEG
jgi:hypothetical protein